MAHLLGPPNLLLFPTPQPLHPFSFSPLLPSTSRPPALHSSPSLLPLFPSFHTSLLHHHPSTPCSSPPPYPSFPLSSLTPFPSLLPQATSPLLPPPPLSSLSSSAQPQASPPTPATPFPSSASPPPPLPSPTSSPTSQKQQGRGLRLFLAGGIAGAVARTCTAPLDRIKLLLQVQNLGQLGTKAGAYTGVVQAAAKITREEGILAFWKGNMLNVIRVFPYSAAQFASHEQYKVLLAGEKEKLSVLQRLAAGAMAGMTATALTHPLDTVRLRLAMPVSGYTGLVDAFATISRQEGLGALYKGLFPTLLGVAPYAAINFSSYDLLKSAVYGQGWMKQSVAGNLLLGAAAGTIATTVCYPLDTVRRRMQMKGEVYKSTLHAFSTMLKTEGVRGFYRGWWANTLKVVPQNSIRFVTYEFCKQLLGITKARTDT